MTESEDIPADPVVDDTEALYLSFDAEGQIQRWNQTVLEVVRVEEARLEGMSLRDLLGSEPGQQLLAIATDEADLDRVTTVINPDGEQARWYAFRPVRLSGGGGDGRKPAEFVAVGRRVEDRPPEPDSRTILDRMGDAFFATDDEWRLTYANARGADVLSRAIGRDLKPSELRGLHLWEEVPAAVDTVFFDKYHAAMESQDPVEFEATFEPLDSQFEVRAFPSPTGLSVYFRDVTANRRRRDTLREREEVLREMHEVIADTSRSFTDQVRALLAIGCDQLDTDYGTLSRVRGDQYVFEVVQSPDGQLEEGSTVPLSATNCERTAATEQTLVLEDIATDAPALAERPGFTEWGIACYLGAPVFVDGEIFGTFCFYDEEPRDTQFFDWHVTLVDLMSKWIGYELEREQTKERLQRQNERLEEFASVVSHDLRNPLNVLGGSLELAEETADTEHFDRCYRAVARMETLIDDLLALARAGKDIDETEPVDLKALVEACWTNVETGNADIRVETDRVILADETRLRQLLENLLRNAVEHAGPDVTVTIGNLADGFYVADDGPGIPAPDQEQVFESGYSTSEAGTGFGLSIVEEIAEAHRWSVRITEGEMGSVRFEFSGVERV